MNLAALQGAYRAYLLDGRSDDLSAAIVADSFDAEERLRIYRNNFLISLAEALRANFPVTQQLVGPEFFEQVARAFILRHPPTKPCLAEFGEGFGDYLEHLPELRALPYVAEMARFEFARIAAYHAPQEMLLTDAAMAQVPPEALSDLPIRLAAHARLLTLRHPIAALWQAHQAAEPDLEGIDLSPQKQVLLVCRPLRQLILQMPDPDAAAFLAAVRAPTTLAKAAEACGSDLDPERLGAAIGFALKYRLLVSRSPTSD